MVTSINSNCHIIIASSDSSIIYVCVCVHVCEASVLHVCQKSRYLPAIRSIAIKTYSPVSKPWSNAPSISCRTSPGPPHIIITDNKNDINNINIYGIIIIIIIIIIIM